MSENVPEWSQGDRLRKSLRAAGITVQDMADYLGVARGTVSTWMNDRIRPDKRTLRLWAMRTGVPLEWIEQGEMKNAAPGMIRDGVDVAGAGFEPATSGLRAWIARSRLGLAA